MYIACSVGFHKWTGCKCAVCGKTRDQDHKWNGCKCSVCSQARDQDHKWNGHKCESCGLTRPHEWNGAKCTVCSAIRPLRPPAHDPKCYPFTLAPGAEEEAEKIAKLCGYAIWCLGEESILEFGEVIAWQIADVTSDEFILKCKRYCAQAEQMSRPMLASHCMASMPLISKYADWFKQYGRDARIGELTFKFTKEAPETAAKQPRREVPMTGALADLVKQSGASRRILCGSMVEYFQDVAKQIYEAGVDRRATGRKEQIAGKSYIIDVWVLPDGTTLECGYPE